MSNGVQNEETEAQLTSAIANFHAMKAAEPEQPSRASVNKPELSTPLSRFDISYDSADPLPPANPLPQSGPALWIMEARCEVRTSFVDPMLLTGAHVFDSAISGSRMTLIGSRAGSNAPWGLVYDCLRPEVSLDKTTLAQRAAAVVADNNDYDASGEQVAAILERTLETVRPRFKATRDLSFEDQTGLMSTLAGAAVDSSEGVWVVGLNPVAAE
jgi:hypothetical protein